MLIDIWSVKVNIVIRVFHARGTARARPRAAAPVGDGGRTDVTDHVAGPAPGARAPTPGGPRAAREERTCDSPLLCEGAAHPVYFRRFGH
jgi:hypothetical protein